MNDDWQPIETCPQDGLFLVHEDGAIRVMYRSRGEWEATAVALDQWGASTADIKVRETGVYVPTHWMPLPDPPRGEAEDVRSDRRLSEPRKPSA